MIDEWSLDHLKQSSKKKEELVRLKPGDDSNCRPQEDGDRRGAGPTLQSRRSESSRGLEMQE